MMDIRLLEVVVCEQLFSWNWHYYQIPETAVHPGDVVFDCGAAEGLFSYLVREQAECVYCFEPLAEFHPALRATFAANHNVHVVGVALSHQPGEGFLDGGGLEATLVPDRGPGQNIQVHVESVDSFCDKHKVEPTYIKADLEGHELEFLKGAAETIRRQRPKLAITTYHRKGDANRLSSYVKHIDGRYSFRFRGLEANWGEPVLMHAW
jgi:FkbM family methyltransferase